MVRIGLVPKSQKYSRLIRLHFKEFLISELFGSRMRCGILITHYNTTHIAVGSYCLENVNESRPGQLEM
jgi:uncharacterized membrane protein